MVSTNCKHLTLINVEIDPVLSLVQQCHRQSLSSISATLNAAFDDVTHQQLQLPVNNMISLAIWC